MKNSLKVLSNRFEQAKENISEYEGRSIQIVWSSQVKKEWRKMNSLRDSSYIFKHNNICMMGVSEEEMREKV